MTSSAVVRQLRPVGSGYDLTDFQGLYDLAPCGFVATDRHGTILQVNQTLLGWLGRARDEVVGVKAFTDLLTVGGRIYYETHYRPSLELEGGVTEVAVDLLAADGSRLPVLLRSVVDGESGRFPGVVRTAVFSALQRREYEQELVRERERARRSEARAHEVAQRLQQMLIPPAPPTIDGLDVGAAYRPAGDGGMIGGDFYDVFEFESQDWLVAIGDVSGKGIDAAAVAGLARHTIRAAAVRSRQLDVVMQQVNRVLLADHSDRFCTIVLVRFTRTGDRWNAAVCAAGHPLPLLLRPGHNPVEVGKHGGMVGAFTNANFHHVPIPIEPGDTLLLYTDGVTEARAGGDFYGEKGLAGSVRRPWASASELAASVVDDVVVYQAGLAADDIAVVAIHIP